MKKGILYTIISLVSMSFLLSACSQEELDPYSGSKSGIFIQQIYSTDIYGNPYSYQDSTSYSFANAGETVTYAYVRFYVRTIGELADYDRPYTLKVVAEETAAFKKGEESAAEGEDFDLEENEFTIKANQNYDIVKVRLKRTAKLRQTTLRIKLGIEPNQYFEMPIDGYKNSSSWSIDGPINSTAYYKIKFDEKYQEPSYWDWMDLSEYFGNFTVARYLELNKVMGWTSADWADAGYSGAKVQYGKMDFAASAFQKHLQEMADAGTPVVDDDGSYIQLPEDYKVDYSHIGSKA